MGFSPRGGEGYWIKDLGLKAIIFMFLLPRLKKRGNLGHLGFTFWSASSMISPTRSRVVSSHFPDMSATGRMTVYMAGVTFIGYAAAPTNGDVQVVLYVYFYITRA